MFNRVLAAGAVVALGAGLAGAALSQSRPFVTGPYLPLREADRLAVGAGVGCSCTLVLGRRAPFTDLMLLAGNRLTTRTRAGRQTCSVSGALVERLNAGRETVINCNARRLSIRVTNSAAGANDDSGGDARVTVGAGRQSTVIRGAWACAC